MAEPSYRRTNADAANDLEDEKRAAEGSKADADVGFSKKQDEASERLKAFAAKTNASSGEEQAPKMKAGEDLEAFGARTAAWRKRKQTAQASALR